MLLYPGKCYSKRLQNYDWFVHYPWGAAPLRMFNYVVIIYIYKIITLYKTKVCYIGIVLRNRELPC